MDLDLSTEQQMLRDSLREFCEAEVGTGVVRAAEQDPAIGMNVAKRLAELGVTNLRIPADLGGSGLGLTELAVAYIELGRALAPGPHFECGVVSAGLLARLSDPVARELLAGIAAGERWIITAWQERENRIDLPSMQAATRREGGRILLDGEKHFVPYARFADRLLVPAAHPDRPTHRVICVVDPSARGIEFVAQPNLADEPLMRLRFTGTPVEALLGADEDVTSAWESAFQECLVAMAALAAGGAERILEITTKYACEREQFGKPIGAFQAIAHYLADAAVQVEGARTLVYRAASAADDGDPFRHFALMAKLKACATFRSVSATAIQVHGGLGFTLEADPQLYYRRAKHQQLMYGDPAWLECRIADGLFAGTHPHPIFDL